MLNIQLSYFGRAKSTEFFGNLVTFSLKNGISCTFCPVSKVSLPGYLLQDVGTEDADILYRTVVGIGADTLDAADDLQPFYDAAEDRI